jgi:hypothetical protein
MFEVGLYKHDVKVRPCISNHNRSGGTTFRYMGNPKLLTLDIQENTNSFIDDCS